LRAQQLRPVFRLVKHRAGRGQGLVVYRKPEASSDFAMMLAFMTFFGAVGPATHPPKLIRHQQVRELRHRSQPIGEGRRSADREYDEMK